ncbi:EamA family transporter [Cyanobacterium sp. uoEpiScrs1]|uniref:EamA family transporter n=1 Tax=Cyanobacterium sp. uoEpiScrs1 TaxID=2976343 RepID=UPI00226A01DA|nr:EamA family transporter [Cyanobacterium sp. uoEpiScrs1]
MTYKELCLLLFSVLTSTMGQLLLKLGATKLGKVNTDNAVSHILNIVMTPELLAGLSCYGLGAIAYILLLTRVQLSIAGPSAALIYIFSVLIGYFFFQESIPIYRACGLGFIICGVILVVWKP